MLGHGAGMKCNPTMVQGCEGGLFFRFVSSAGPFAPTDVGRHTEGCVVFYLLCFVAILLHSKQNVDGLNRSVVAC